MKIDYFLNGIDQKGNHVLEHRLSQDEVIALLTAALMRAPDTTSEGPVETEEAEPSPAASGRAKLKEIFGKKDREKEGGKKGGCPECGSPSRHKSSCSRSGVKKKPKARVTPDALDALDMEAGYPSYTRRTLMSVDKFQQVKIATSHDVPQDVIAREMGLDPDEVQSAILNKTYADYQAA